MWKHRYTGLQERDYRGDKIYILTVANMLEVTGAAAPTENTVFFFCRLSI